MTMNSQLWAITSYFNPVGFHRRLTNYRSFRRLLGAPLIAVELSFGAPFELHPEDAEILIQIRGQSVLWQKERLLNVALQHLPKDCKAVAWLDCDVVFADDGWAVKALEQLDRFPIVQLFTDFYDLSKDVGPELANLPANSVAGRSFGATLAHDPVWSREPTSKSLSLRGGPLMGLAWAGQREVLEAACFYDACIVGGGIRAMALAALSRQDDAISFLRMNARQEEHYRSWAEKWSRLINGEVGHLETALLHLWHGDIANRGYTLRYEQLMAFDFDPFQDLIVDDNGCWRWNTKKLQMHQVIRDYFASRREDG